MEFPKQTNEAWDALFSKGDTNTRVEFARSFRNTKVLSAFMPIGEGYGANGVNQRIMNETGADALMTLTLDLEIAKSKDDKVLMIPKLAFEIFGKTNGNTSNTKYLTGTIKSTTGVQFLENPVDSGFRRNDAVECFSPTCVFLAQE